eukprot:scaffold48176_cov30-Tisochrysis_lutea.AAC.1
MRQLWDKARHDTHATHGYRLRPMPLGRGHNGRAIRRLNASCCLCMTRSRFRRAERVGLSWVGGNVVVSF